MIFHMKYLLETLEKCGYLLKMYVVFSSLKSELSGTLKSAW